jgi:hypothetical protein
MPSITGSKVSEIPIGIFGLEAFPIQAFLVDKTLSKAIF